MVGFVCRQAGSARRDSNGPQKRLTPSDTGHRHMFRRQAKSTFNSHRWFSHRSGSRKSTYALTRGAAVAMSVAAVAAATIASQKFIEGLAIHNDASAPGIAAATSGKVSAGTTRVGGTNDGDEELKLL